MRETPLYSQPNFSVEPAGRFRNLGLDDTAHVTKAPAARPASAKASTHGAHARAAPNNARPPFRPSSRNAALAPSAVNAPTAAAAAPGPAHVANPQSQHGARHSARRAAGRQRLRDASFNPKASLKPSGPSPGLYASRSAVFGAAFSAQPDVFPSATAALAAANPKQRPAHKEEDAAARVPLKAQNSAPIIHNSFVPKVNTSKLGFRPPPTLSRPASATANAARTSSAQRAFSVQGTANNSKIDRNASFRSAALTLEVELQEGLASLEPAESSQRSAALRVGVASKVFAKAIDAAGSLRALLAAIKAEYDAALAPSTGASARRGTSASAAASARRSRDIEAAAARAAKRADEEKANAAAAARAAAAERRARELERMQIDQKRQIERLREQRDEYRVQAADLEKEYDASRSREEELVDLLESLRRGEVSIRALDELHGGEGAQQDPDEDEFAAGVANSAFKDVPAAEVTWEVPLSARQPKSRPQGVPALEISLLGDATHTDADRMMAELKAEAEAEAQATPADDEEEEDPSHRHLQRAPSRAGNRRSDATDDDNEEGDESDLDGFDSWAVKRFSMDDLQDLPSSPETKSPSGPSAVNSP